MMKKLLFLFLFIPSIAWGAVYHVSTTPGDDIEYTTIAQVEAGTFTAGDIIAFKGGDTWTEHLHFPSGGSTNNYITITSYGTGRAILAPIRLYSKDWIHITNINVTSPNTVNNLGCITANACANILIDNCTLDGNNSNSPIVSSTRIGTDWTEYLTVNNCIMKNGGVVESGFNGSAAQFYCGCRYITISNNDIIDCEEVGIQIYNNETPTMTYASHDLTAKNNTIYYTTVQTTSGHGGINLGYDAYNCLVDGNYIYDCYSGIGTDDGTNNNVFQNNIIINCKENIACYGDTNTVNNKFLFNTSIAGSNTVKSAWFRGTIGTGNKFKNNISISLKDHWENLLFEGGVNVESDYNCFYNYETLRLTDNATSYTNLSDWTNATSQDLHSIAADPLLTDTYRLRKGSPAINAGTDVGVEEDYFGNKRVGTPDIGACEYVRRINNGNFNNGNSN